MDKGAILSRAKATESSDGLWTHKKQARSRPSPHRMGNEIADEQAK